MAPPLPLLLLAPEKLLGGARDGAGGAEARGVRRPAAVTRIPVGPPRGSADGYDEGPPSSTTPPLLPTIPHSPPPAADDPHTVLLLGPAAPPPPPPPPLLRAAASVGDAVRWKVPGPIKWPLPPAALPLPQSDPP